MRSCTRRPIARILLCALLAAPGARAETAGETVVSGTATFEKSGNVMTIHASDGAIINYTHFGIATYEEMHFVQPSSDARVMNRVLGDATHIDGGLYANGIVYIVNPAGIFFGPFAVVDVGGLYAAAGDISNEDFLARVDRFTLSGVVENAGSIESPEVALLGTAVRNHGSIYAPDGTIALVAGEKILLAQLGGHIAVEVEGAAGSADAPAIEQTGSADAGAGAVSFTTGDVYSLAINHTGITRGRETLLRAGSGTVQVAGTLDASDRSAGGTGGSIDVTGERVALVGARLDASGDAGGGEIRVGGDLHGGGALPNARRTYVDEASALRADAIASGDGGRAIVWADEATAFHGTVSARGGAAGGDGGFAEISGAALAADGDVDLSAPAGASGTLLYDPKDILIHGGSTGASPAPDDSDASGGTLTGSALGTVLFADIAALDEPFDIYEQEIEGTNANIELEAGNSITSTGTFDHIANGEAVGVVRVINGNSLTMRTRNNVEDTGPTPGIHLSGVSFQTGGTGSIAIATGTDGAGGGGTGTDAANIEVRDLTTAGGDVSVSTRNGSIQFGSVTTSGADGPTGGAAGDIEILAGDSDKLGDSDVTVTGQLIARGGTGTTGAGGAGGSVTVRSDGVPTTPFPTQSTQQVIAGGGDISLQNVDTRGGTSEAAGGGAGGAVRIETTDGAIDAGNVTTSGGKGDTTGGRAGSIAILTRDANGDSANASIDVGTVTGVGGEGTKGAGGAGAFIDVRAQASQRVVQTNPPTDPLPTPPVVLQEAKGGGAVAIVSIDVRGGAGGTAGGNAGNAVAQARGEGNALSVGSITAMGGSGSGGNGGRGGNVTLLAQDRDLVIDDPITTSGGSGENTANTALGGSGGNISLTTGIEDADIGDVRIQALLDAREGASENTDANSLANIDGGTISIDSTGSIDQVGSAPLIKTTGDVSLTADDDIGQATGALLVQGGDERRTGSTGALLDEDVLSVSAGGTADVQVVAGGRFLDLLSVRATSTSADIHVTQPGDHGGDVIDMVGTGGQMIVNRVDTSDNQVSAQVQLLNPDDDAVDGTLVLATGSVDAGGFFQALSPGDLVVGTGNGLVINGAASDPSSTDAPDPAFVLLFADFDSDGTGAVRDAPGAATGTIDLLGDAETPGELDLAGSGIGVAGDPITISGGGELAALNRPKKADPDHEGEFISDPDATSGIFVRNVASGDLALAPGFSNLNGAVIDAGSGDIQITNEVGDLSVTGRLSAKPTGTANGAGGDVTLAVSDPTSEIALNTPFAIESGGVQTYDGDVAVARAASVVADAGVDINGGLDTSDTAATAPAFTATLGDEATDVTPFSVSGGIGGTRALGSFALRAPDGGGVSLATSLVRTTGAQSYGADLDLAQFTALEAGTQIRFDGAGDEAGVQTVTVTVPAGFSLETTAVPISPEATIARPNGSLTLASPGGSILIGDGEKLSAAGSLALSGNTVRFTDLSALDISVTSPDAQVFARSPGLVATPGGDTILDGGTDLVANTVTFSSAPTVVGSGPAPRVATLSGAAQSAGALRVGPLPAAVTPADIALGSRVFDLAIPAVDPGHETQEIPTTPVEPPLEPQPSKDRAGPAEPVSREEVAAFFACAPLGVESAPEGCAATAEPAYGSALDTERAVEIARAYRELLGDSPDAVAGRAALARAAADPQAEIGAASSPAGRVYLTEVARVLGQVRLLGLGERYREVRADMLAAVAAAIGSRELDAARLGPAVDARAMGMPI